MAPRRRNAYCLVLAAVIAAGTAHPTASASAASWPAHTSIVSTTGPVPFLKGWKQCAQLEIENPAGMVSGRWQGTLRIRGGKLASSDGADVLFESLAGEYGLAQYKDTHSIASGTAQFVDFCVAYSEKWAATTEVTVSADDEDVSVVGKDEELFVQVQTDGKTGQTSRMLMKRQSGAGFAPDYSSGTCRCLPQGNGYVAPPPPPANVIASSSSATSRTTVTTSTSTRTSTTTTTTTTRGTPTIIASEDFSYSDASISGRSGGSGWSAAWYKSSIWFDNLATTSGKLYYPGGGTQVKASARIMSRTVSAAVASKAWVTFDVAFTTQNGYGTPTFRFLNDSAGPAVLAVGNNGYVANNYGLLYNLLQSYNVTNIALNTLQHALVEIDYSADVCRLWMDASTTFNPTSSLPSSAAIATVPGAVNFLGFDVVVRGLDTLDNIKVYILPK